VSWLDDLDQTIKIYQAYLQRAQPILEQLPAARYIGAGLLFLNVCGDFAGFAAGLFNPSQCTVETRVPSENAQLIERAMREFGVPFQP
jgi:hypothetical protein